MIRDGKPNDSVHLLKFNLSYKTEYSAFILQHDVYFIESVDEGEVSALAGIFRLLRVICERSFRYRSGSETRTGVPRVVALLSLEIPLRQVLREKTVILRERLVITCPCN